MSSQDFWEAFFVAGVEEESILHLSCGVLGREVEGGEVEEVFFNVWSFFERESHVSEYGDHFFYDASEGMDSPLRF